MKKTHVILSGVLVLVVSAGCAKVSIDLGGTAESVNTVESAATSVEIPIEPAVEDKSGDLIPDGVLVSTGDESSVVYLDTSGQILQEIQLPGAIGIDSEDVAIAGAEDPDGDFPPVVFHSWDPEQAMLAAVNGQVETLRISNGFLSMVAAPGQPAVAFSEVTINDENYPHSFLFAGNPDNLATIPAFYDLVDAPYYWALKPVGLVTTAGQPQGVFYIKTGWGIGGVDLIFAPNRGLYYFDLTSGDNIMYLDDNRNFQGISPDLTFAASVQAPELSLNDLSMTVVNLASGAETKFALDPATDRGAGFTVFSPDNRLAAWLEATGSMISEPYDFHPRVRVGDISAGGVVQAIEDAAAVQLINGDKITMLQPVGWLDTGLLLIETRGELWDDVTLLKLDVSSGSLTIFASGSFLGFGYQ